MPPLVIVPSEDGARVTGELDMATASELRAFLDGSEPNSHPLVLDVSGLTFMDSSGLEVVLRAAATRGETGPLVLLRPTRAVLRVLEIAVPGGVDGLEVKE